MSADLSRDAPQTLLSPEGKYHLGRWAGPVKDPSLHQLTFLQRFFQKKEWVFYSISSRSTLYGVAVSQMNYVSTAIIYYMDANRSHYELLNPLVFGGFHTTFPHSSIDGCAQFSSKSISVEICAADPMNDPHRIQWMIKAKGTFPSGNQINIDAIVGSTSSPIGTLAVSYPLGPHRVAYTHKTGGMKSQGQVIQTWPESDSIVSNSLEASVASMDWTRSMHRHLTVWFWVSLHWMTSSFDRIGINLSHGVYPHTILNATTEVGLENAIWINDRVVPILSPLVVEGAPGQNVISSGKTWYCHTIDDSISLTFTPIGIVHASAHFLPEILSADLRHFIGTYSGFIKVEDLTYPIENRPGILEDHFAYW